MNIQLKKWGNSIGFRIPYKIAEEMGIDENSVVEITRTENGLNIKPKQKLPTLRDLIDTMPDDFQYPDDVSDFVNSEPMGREVV